MGKLSSSALSEIQSNLDGLTSKQSKSGIPGCVFNAIDKEGNYLAQKVSGQHALSGSAAEKDMTLDSIFYIASCTKMVTGLACMQLVEKGDMKLDDHEWLYSVCPELKEKKVVNEKGDGLIDRQGEITLRLLLSHTAGFGYTFFNTRLLEWSRPTGYDEFGLDREDYLEMPLVNQPGKRWEYGINIDWAGIAVERVSKLSLDAYFKKNIFEPLGIKNISFIPTKQMRENLVTMQQKYPDGSFADADHIYRRAIWHAERGGNDKKDIYHAGGAGLFAKPAEYCQILATLLNDGTSPTTGAKILSKKTVDEMFTNQIPHIPDFGRQYIPAAKPMLTNPSEDLFPQEGNPPQGWGLTFMLMPEGLPTGRGKNAAYWAGIINSFWWCDREKGVAGFMAGQTLPFGDMGVIGTWMGCEKAVYDGLSGETGQTELPVRNKEA